MSNAPVSGGLRTQFADGWCQTLQVAALQQGAQLFSDDEEDNSGSDAGATMDSEGGESEGSEDEESGSEDEEALTKFEKKARKSADADQRTRALAEEETQDMLETNMEEVRTPSLLIAQRSPSLLPARVVIVLVISSNTTIMYHLCQRAQLSWWVYFAHLSDKTLHMQHMNTARVR